VAAVAASKHRGGLVCHPLHAVPCVSMIIKPRMSCHGVAFSLIEVIVKMLDL